MKKHLVFLLITCAAFFSACESTTPPVSNQPLGDVGNDLEFLNGKLYIVLDNSDKIVVATPPSIVDDRLFILDEGAFGKNNARLDEWDWNDSSLSTNLFTSNLTGTITFPAKSAPWKILQISPTEALAAEYYTGEMAVVNLNSNTITSTIQIGAGQNSLASIGSAVYATTGSNTIVAIDKSQKTVTSKKWIGENPMQVIADSSRNKLLVLTSGNYSPKTAGKILWVDPSTFAVTDSIVIDTLHYINEIVPAGNKAYILFGDGVKVLDLLTHKLSSDPLITKTYFGGYHDSIRNFLYLGTAVDFQSNDAVDIFDLTAHSLKRTLNVGIAPSFFAVVR
ncbi:MAG: YncE family protein [Candidatus Kapaibacterium sp.]